MSNKYSLTFHHIRKQAEEKNFHSMQMRMKVTKEIDIFILILQIMLLGFLKK